MDRNRGVQSYFLMIVLLMIVLFAMNFRKFQDNDYTQTQLLTDMQNKVVKEIYITPNSEAPTGYATVVFDGSSKKLYATDIRQLEEIVRAHGYEPIVEDIQRESWFATYVMPLLLVLVICFFFFMMMNAQHNANSGSTGKMMNFGKSRAKMSLGDNKINFQVVAGLQEEKEDLAATDTYSLFTVLAPYEMEN